MKPQDRIKIFQRKLMESNLAGALLTYSRNILYYTGTAQPSYLAVWPENFRLFVRSGFDFAVQDVFIDREKIEEERRLESIFKKIPPPAEAGIRRIGVELDILTVQQF